MYISPPSVSLICCRGLLARNLLSLSLALLVCRLVKESCLIKLVCPPFCLAPHHLSPTPPPTPPSLLAVAAVLLICCLLCSLSRCLLCVVCRCAVIPFAVVFVLYAVSLPSPVGVPCLVGCCCTSSVTDVHHSTRQTQWEPPDEAKVPPIKPSAPPAYSEVTTDVVTATAVVDQPVV